MKNLFNVIIIDNNESDVDSLVFALKAHTSFHVKGFAKNGSTGKRLIFKTMPDLVFLETMLPDVNGLELLNQIKDDITWDMQIIFYTNCDKKESLQEAIRKSAFDYLLKPINTDELARTLKRYSEKLPIQSLQSIPFHILVRSLLPLEETFIILSPTNELLFLHPLNIGYFKYNSKRKYWEIYLNNSPIPVSINRSTTGELILQNSPSFVQIHQSYIININYLIKIKDKKCVFYPPFDMIKDISISNLYLKKLQKRFVQL